MARPAVRRGLIVALDGLAIWLLAVVIGGYVDPGSVAGASDGLVPAAIDTTLHWATTPGVGALELLAYAGLVVAVLGPLWYGIVRPIGSRMSGRFDADEPGRKGDDFQYDPPDIPARAGGRAERLVRSHREATPLPPVASGETDNLQWVGRLFDPEPPPGGFVRGGAVPPGVGTSPPAEPLEPAGDSSAAPERDPVEPAPAPMGTDHQAAGGPATGSSPAIDELRRGVAAARIRVETVAERLASARDGRDAETVAADLEAITATTDETLEPLRTVCRAGRHPARDRISALWEAERRLEPALDARSGGE